MKTGSIGRQGTALECLTSETGSIFAEYAVLLTLVAIVFCLAIAALGPLLVNAYLTQQTWVMLPFP